MKPRPLLDKSSVEQDLKLRSQILVNSRMIHLPLITILTLCGVQSMKNGRQASAGEFPFLVSIQHRLFHVCSGTIIDKYHILTIAHVVSPLPASSLLVVPGRSVVRWPYDTALTVNNIYPHPDYQEFAIPSSGQIDLYWENDIAILRLIQPLPLNTLIGVMTLSTINFESYHCFACAMISWNYIDEINMETVVLMWDVVSMVENNECEHWGIQVLANQQCFIDLFETAFISTEDLGSPIICGDSMVGLIAKEARQEDATSPATFLSTLNYAAFISEIINGGRMEAQTGEFPYMVSIWHGNKHACGGIIVNAEQVITAGQCIRSNSRHYATKGLKITVESNHVSLFDDSLQWYLVKHIEVHPHYLPSQYLNDPSEWIEHDIGLITVSTPFSWSPTVQRFRLADADDFSTKQLCQVLHWTREITDNKREYRRLTKTTAVLVDDKQPLVRLRKFQIVAKELYSANNPELADIGNPIICGGHPLGIMVKTFSIDVESQTPLIIFLRIRPYASMNFFSVE